MKIAQVLRFWIFDINPERFDPAHPPSRENCARYPHANPSRSKGLVSNEWWLFRVRERERNIYERCSRIKNFYFFKWILRDSIRHPRLAVKIAHVTPMPTLPSQKVWLVMTSDTSFAISTTLLSQNFSVQFLSLHFYTRTGKNILHISLSFFSPSFLHFLFLQKQSLPDYLLLSFSSLCIPLFSLSSFIIYKY